LRLIGSGLSSRQNFRRQLELATLNPRDSDAHYQLGLIYQTRRQYVEAVSRFKQAIEIDPREAGAHYQLGRIALEQGRHQEALDCFCAAAEIDEKHSSNEVWRDMGIACFHLGDRANACRALERYVERREYDPEGLYWLGKALVAEDRKPEAAAMFKQAIEAAQSAPNHRRGVVRQWAGKARAEMKALGQPQ
jgi:tetratricopeptide (TPR) repeat protein